MTPVRTPFKEDRDGRSTLSLILVLLLSIFMITSVLTGAAGIDPLKEGDGDKPTRNESDISSLSAEAWPSFGYDRKNSRRSPYNTSYVDGTLRWSCDLNSLITISSPAIDPEGTLYLGTSDGKLYAIAPDGTKKWNYTTGDSILTTPAVDENGTVYFGSNDGKLYALEQDGALKWSFETEGNVYSSPNIAQDGTIYFGCGDTKIYALRPDGTERWNYTTGKSVRASPAIADDGTIYIGSYDGELYALNPDGSLQWTYDTGNYVTSSVSIGPDGNIYFGSYAGKVYSVHPNGTLRWEFDTGQRVFSSPGFGESGPVYIASTNGKVYSLTSNGALRWSYQTGESIESSPAIGADGTVYIGSDDGRLYAFQKNGTVRWSYKTGRNIDSSPSIGADGALYIASWDKKLYAFGGRPGEPKNFTASSGDHEAVLTWEEPTDKGGSSITEYRIYRGNSSRDLSLFNTVGADTTTFTDTGLTNGLKYFYQVSAVNTWADGDKSKILNITPSASPPSSPTDLSSSRGDQSVELTWSAPSDNGGARIEEYRIYRGNTSSALARHDIVESNYTSYLDQRLQNGYTYYYYVTAVNSAGESESSQTVNATPLSVPDSPQYLLTDRSDHTIQLSWDPPADDGGDEITEYRIYRGTSDSNISYIDSVDANETSYQDTGLTNGETYYYHVTAVNPVGESDPSNLVSDIPKGVPSAPQNLTADGSNMTIELNWEAPEDDGGSPITEYRIYRGNSSGNLSYLCSVDQTTYVDTNVTNGTRYYYRVSAVNEIGEGAKTNETSEIAHPGAPGFTFVSFLAVVTFIAVYYWKREH